MSEETELPLNASVLDRRDERHPRNHQHHRHQRPSGKNRKRQTPRQHFRKQCARRHTQHIGHRLTRHHHRHGLRFLALIGQRLGDQRGRAEKRAMRQARNETSGQQHGGIERNRAQRVADQCDDHEQNNEILRRYLTAEHQNQRAHAHADRICGNIMACRRNADLHGGGCLRQNAHHHEFGGTKNKGAGSQSQNASFHSLSSMNVKRVGVRLFTRLCITCFLIFQVVASRICCFAPLMRWK